MATLLSGSRHMRKLPNTVVHGSKAKVWYGLHGILFVLLTNVNRR